MPCSRHVVGRQCCVLDWTVMHIKACELAVLTLHTWAAMSNPNSLAMGSIATLRTMRSMLHKARATARGSVVLRNSEPAGASTWSCSPSASRHGMDNMSSQAHPYHRCPRVVHLEQVWPRLTMLLCNTVSSHF